MINLLPQFEKKKLLNEYRLRAGIIVLGTVLILELLMAVLLSPSYYLIKTTEKTLRADLVLKKQIASSTVGEDPQKKSALIQAEATLLNPPNPPARPIDMLPSQILGEILTQKPSGIGVHSFSYAKSGTAAAAAQFSGVAETREDLLAFQRMLKENLRFSDIKYAQSFITRKTDIDFQLTVMIK
jgi:hypothetical protein